MSVSSELIVRWSVWEIDQFMLYVYDVQMLEV